MPGLAFRMWKEINNFITQIPTVADYGCNSPFESSFKIYISE